jgi:phosphoglycolate phosphatase
VKRLLLFDIDGTLVRGGPAKRAFELAMEAAFGTAGPIGSHDFSGKTDPQIARELLRLADFEDDEIDAGLGLLWREYLTGLEARLSELPMTLLPGVPSLLHHLSGMSDVALGLLTGNIAEGARLKLDSVGLTGYFSVGGYGSDSEVREELTPFALKRAANFWGTTFSPDSVVVVGDTPRDVFCGRHGGTRTVAVATGRYDVKSLTEAGADRVLESLDDLKESVQALLE